MEICKAMIVIKTSIFPASKEEVFNKLQKLKLLQYIAWPVVRQIN